MPAGEPSLTVAPEGPFAGPLRQGYRLIERIGRGGSGEVWKAEAPGGFLVALKAIALGRRLGALEARSIDILRTIRHPHVVTTFGSWLDHETLVLGMELADRTLWDRFVEASGQGLAGIPRTELVVALFDAATGIDFLNGFQHDVAGQTHLGVQHRDLKPQNLLLFGDGVKVGDLGMARLLDHTSVHHTGSWTFAYAAPEFFRNRASRWSDQYSLAVTYCKLRTGHLPFTGTPEQIVLGHLMGEPDLSHLPPPERPIIARALAKDPAARWPDCRAFVTALTLLPAESLAFVPPDSHRHDDEPPPSDGPETLSHPSGTGHFIPGPEVDAADMDSVSDPDLPALAGADGSEVSFVPAALPSILDDAFPSLWDDDDAAARRPAPSRPDDDPLSSLWDESEESFPALEAPDLDNLPESGPVEAPDPGPRPSPVPAEADRKRRPGSLAALRLAALVASAGVILGAVMAMRPAPARRPATSPPLIAASPVGPRQTGPATPPVVPPRPPLLPDAELVIPSPSPTVPMAALPPPLEPPRPTASVPAPEAVEDVASTGADVAHAPADAAVEPARAVPFGVAAAALAALADGAEEAPPGALAPDDTPVELEPIPPASELVEAGAAAAEQPVAAAPVANRLESADTHNERGLAHYRAGRLAEARAELDAALELDPDHALARENRGALHLREGRFAAAIADLDTVLAQDPRNAIALNNRALARRALGQSAGAVADYDAALAIEPHNPRLHLNRGMALGQGGDDRAAVAAFTQAIWLSPGNPRAYRARGDALSRLGEPVRARADHDRAATLEFASRSDRSG